MHMQVHIADHRLSVRQTDLPMLSAKDDRMQEPRLRVRRTIGDRSPIPHRTRTHAHRGYERTNTNSAFYPFRGGKMRPGTRSEAKSGVRHGYGHVVAP